MSCNRTVKLEISRRFSNSSIENNHYHVSVIQARQKRGVLVIYKIKLFKTLTSKTEGKVNQSHYRPEEPRRSQEVKVPRLRDNGPG